MKKQKELTFMEAIAEARKGAKLRNVDTCAMIEWSNSELVDYVQKMPILINEHTITSRWEVAIPAPKPKVKVALYAYHFADRPFPEISTYYYKDEKIFSGAFIGKGIKWFKRLDWSEIEVEE